MNYTTHSIFVRQISPDLIDVATDPGNGYVEMTLQNLNNVMGIRYITSSAYSHIDEGIPFERMIQNQRQRRIYIPEHNNVWVLEAGSGLLSNMLIFSEEDFEEI